MSNSREYSGKPSGHGGATAKITCAFLLCLVILAGVAARFEQFTWPWTTDFRGQLGSYHGSIAKNYVKWGCLETKFAPVANVGSKDPSEFRYYLNHPHIIDVLLSLSLRLFGEEEWAVRLVPLLFNLATIPLFFLIVKKLWDWMIALCATALFAILPMGVFFASLADVHGSLPLFFCTLIILLYLRFTEKPSNARAVALWGVFLLGTLAGWAVYYLAALLPLYHLATRGGRRWVVWLIPALSLAAFAAFIGYVGVVTGGGFDGSFQHLKKLFLHRALGVSSPFEMPESFSIAELTGKIGGKFWLTYFTIPGIVLLLCWSAATLVKIFLLRMKRGDWMFVLMLAFAIIHIALFTNAAYIHDFWSFYLLGPVALAAVLSVDAVARFVSVKAAAGKLAAVTLVVFVILGLCAHSTLKLWKSGSAVDYAQYAEKMNKIIEQDRGVILTDIDFHWLLFFYMDTPVESAPVNRANFRILRQLPTRGYIFTRNEDTANKRFKEMLQKEIGTRNKKHVGLFNLTYLMNTQNVRETEFPSPIEPPAITDIEKSSDVIRVWFSHPNPDKVSHFLVYRKEAKEVFYLRRIRVAAGEAYAEIPNDRKAGVSVIVTAVDKHGEESDFSLEIKG